MSVLNFISPLLVLVAAFTIRLVGWQISQHAFNRLGGGNIGGLGGPSIQGNCGKISSPIAIDASLRAIYAIPSASQHFGYSVFSYKRFVEADLLYDANPESLHSGSADRQRRMDMVTQTFPLPSLVFYIFHALRLAIHPYRQFILIFLVDSVSFVCFVLVAAAAQTCPETFLGAALAKSQTSKKHVSVTPVVLGAVYLLNPLTIVGSLTLSYQSLQHSLLLASLATLCYSSGRPRTPSYYAWCFSSIPLTLLLFLRANVFLPCVIPFGHLAFTRRHTRDWYSTNSEGHLRPVAFREMITSIAAAGKLFALTLAMWSTLHFISFCLDEHSGTQYLRTNRYLILHEDLTPTMGSLWYLATLMLPRYRELFLILLQGLPYVFALPLVVVFFRAPLIPCLAISSIVCMLDPYFSPLDFPYIVALLLIHSRAVLRQQAGLILLISCCFALTMFPIVKHLWLERNTGNANFCFAFQILFLASLGQLIARWLAAAQELCVPVLKDKDM